MAASCKTVFVIRLNEQRGKNVALFILKNQKIEKLKIKYSANLLKSKDAKLKGLSKFIWLPVANQTLSSLKTK